MKSHKYWRVLCHLNIILGGMFLTFFIIDRFNTAMNFLGNEISKWLLCIFSVCAILLGAVTAHAIYSHNRREHRRNRQQHDDNK
ncbi:MAG: hypothetical protein RR232_03600 [Clostridia bacterium]